MEWTAAASTLSSTVDGMRWFSSDWHLGHENIIRYCARPFDSVEAMNRALIDRVNDEVSPADELWILGDVAFGDMRTNLAPLKLVKAHRVVVVGGNHDRFHPTATRQAVRRDRWVRDYLEWTAAAEVIAGNTTLDVAERVVNVSHFPYVGTDVRPAVRKDGTSIADRFAAWRPVDDGKWLLCGHVHDKWRQRDRMVNVGVDAWGGAPVSEEQLGVLFAAGPKMLDPVDWR